MLLNAACYLLGSLLGWLVGQWINRVIAARSERARRKSAEDIAKLTLEHLGKKN